MMKHEQQTERLEKMSNFFGGSNFSKLNLYESGKRKGLMREKHHNFTQPSHNLMVAS
ncbi:hypothetical protein J3R75_002138 [Oligosphaera ethanolica]|uniref:Uncharacterized protein n=1 Tax=Oligosphaera ethanolica TaxID=760260 RepID=A0AAE3VGV9_9BACT|nr:hypothetical protein [Oligosphaera ethanolica]